MARTAAGVCSSDNTHWAASSRGPSGRNGPAPAPIGLGGAACDSARRRAAAAAGPAAAARLPRPRTFLLLSTSLNSVKVASMGLMAPLACAATLRWLVMPPTFGATTLTARCCGGTALQATCCRRACTRAAGAAWRVSVACMVLLGCAGGRDKQAGVGREQQQEARGRQRACPLEIARG